MTMEGGSYAIKMNVDHAARGQAARAGARTSARGVPRPRRAPSCSQTRVQTLADEARKSGSLAEAGRALRRAPTTSMPLRRGQADDVVSSGSVGGDLQRATGRDRHRRGRDGRRPGDRARRECPAPRTRCQRRRLRAIPPDGRAAIERNHRRHHGDCGARRCGRHGPRGNDPAHPRRAALADSFMDISPGFSAFASEYEKGRPQAVFARLIADLETPVSAFLKLADGQATTPSCSKACRAARRAAAIRSSA